MKKIIALAGSNSKKSINKELASFAANLVEDAEVKILDLNDFELPLFSVDKEEELGKPEKASEFLKLIEESDGIVLSLAEHNGSFSAAFKNIFDWASRQSQRVWADKPMLLLATSPGGRGGASVLATAEQIYPYQGAKIVASYALPSFYDNFQEGKLIESEHSVKIGEAAKLLAQSL